MPTIRDWLEAQGLGEYANPFEAERIEIGDLVALSEADLRELGLPMGPRRRLRRAIDALGREAPTSETTIAEAALNPKYAPAALADKILTARSSIEGERKQVTVLFADVKGSTSIVQDMDPEEICALLDPLQKMMLDAVHAYEGTVNEVLGDGIMAIFGAPIAHEDHAFRACRAALEMQERVQRWREESAEGSAARSIAVRVGINSGDVVVRAINSDLTISYSAMGLTTHLAARMEQMAEAGSIWMTGDTLRLVGGLVEVQPQGEVAVKGLAPPVRAYVLLGLGSARTRLEVAAALGLTPFVGRVRELQTLQETFASVRAGYGQVVSISGDPGIGKSRLMLEFRASLGDSVTWAEGHSVSFGRSMAFHPLVDLARRNFRIEEQDSATTVRAKIAHDVARISPDLEPVLPYVFYLLGVARADEQVCQLDPQIRRAETFDALRRLLLRAAERKPQVLLFEDMHWADTTTQDFLRFLIDSIPRSRALILLTFRTGYDFIPSERSYATRLTLPSLSKGEAGDMAEAVLASSELPSELRALVHRKAEGNPFFVEEVIKALGETGAIRKERGRWLLGRPLDQIVVPDTIQDVLMSRIDRLAEEPRQALQLAAVIGREFTQRLLDRIAEIREGTASVLRELQAIELIYEKALYPELAFMFKHALTQDVAYRSLLTQRRRDLHLRIGEAIEHLYADRLHEHFAVLAHHFACGEDWSRAADYFDKAADRAAASFAVQEALALCAQAIEIIDRASGTEQARAGRQADLRVRRGNLFMSLGDFRRAHDEYAQAAEIARSQADAAREGAATAEMSLASAFAHEFRRGLVEATKAVQLAEQSGQEDILPSAHFTTGFIQLITGDIKHGEDRLILSEKLSIIQGKKFQEANAAANLAFLHSWRGDLDKAIKRAERLIRMSRQNHLVFGLLQALFACGVARTGRGGYDEALACLEEGFDLAEKLDNDFFRSRFLNTIGWVHCETGDLQAAIDYNVRGIDAARDRGDPETLANAELNLGDVHRLQGDLHLSLDYFDRTQRLIREPSTSEWLNWRYSQHLFAGLAETWLAMREPVKADTFCNQCLELATRTGSKKYLARGWRLKGEIARAGLHWDEAERYFGRGLQFAKRVGNPTEIWKSKLVLGQLYADTSRADMALRSFAGVQRILDAIGGRLRTHQLQEGFRGSTWLRAVREQSQVS